MFFGAFEDRPKRKRKKNEVNANHTTLPPPPPFPSLQLWMGTHPTLPSQLSSTSTPTLLSKLISTNPTHYLGPSITAKYPSESESGNLPFLFKVLSIGKALSIQAHPDKELAERLHKDRPEIYKDGNHKVSETSLRAHSLLECGRIKCCRIGHVIDRNSPPTSLHLHRLLLLNQQPEMAIALTDFEGFCGFLPLPVLLLHLLTIPEFSEIIGQPPIDRLAASLSISLPADISTLLEIAKKATSPDATSTDGFSTTSEQKNALRNIFDVLMRSPQEAVTKALKSLVARYSAPKPKTSTSFEAELAPLVLRLNKQYPDDVGVLCCFVLNVVQLKAGAAMFLKADEPHAYISGGECRGFRGDGGPFLKG